MGRAWKNGDVVTWRQWNGQIKVAQRLPAGFGALWYVAGEQQYRLNDRQIDELKVNRLYRRRRHNSVYRFQGRDEHGRMIFTVPISASHEDRVTVTDWWFWTGIKP